MRALTCFTMSLKPACDAAVLSAASPDTAPRPWPLSRPLWCTRKSSSTSRTTARKGRAGFPFRTLSFSAKASRRNVLCFHTSDPGPSAVLRPTADSSGRSLASFTVW